MQETLGIFLLLVALAPLVAAGCWLLVRAQKRDRSYNSENPHWPDSG